ncbi:MAG: hypothetical protein HWE25_05755 [Alphaproteobacteria bacterium]|nr:hypothetical protein [Alphaproteobacteria bacterium]
MKSSVAVIGLIAGVVGATAIAEDQFAFDGMGAMMMEHEASEGFDQVSGQEPASGHCEERQRAFKARVAALEKTYAKAFQEATSRLGTMDVKSIRETAFLTEEQIKSLKSSQELTLGAVHTSLTEHREILAKHRFAFKDKALLAQVEDALVSAEQALRAD